MAKVTDKLLKRLAATAEDAFWEALGLASCGGAYEPEMPETAEAYKADHVSKLETLYNKLAK